jgi:quinohemoprotein ethanol dehydrogenase
MHERVRAGWYLRRASLRGALVIAASMGAHAVAAPPDVSRLQDSSGGADWAAFGRTFGEQHYSPLTDINDKNVHTLGLEWSMDLGKGSSVTVPLAIDGVLYFASGYSVVHAVDAASGNLLWIYDPKVIEAAGHKLRMGWGSRGIGYWSGKIYTATLDGRLIAIDAKTGQPVWSVMTLDKDDFSYITGAPRLFDGKVIIGNAGADYEALRGYVTTYDADTGKQLWRFYVVPGNPANGFENKAMEMAAKTWSGEWWKYGGGGTVWNAITYDAQSDTIYLGTGNGSPWNRKIRSLDQGDNLFLCSIVALDAKTGAYKWHYQVNPGESWDYTATMDMELADLSIDGHLRHVLMTAPKNGFLYVIDRGTGKLISAKPIGKVTWATGIDPKSGRPIEVPEARYPNGISVTMWPGPTGAHNWMPMAFSPKTRLLYIPTISMPATYSDKGITRENWVRVKGTNVNGGVNFVADSSTVKDPDAGTSALLAWNPVTQTQAWKVPTPAIWNGGVMATAGNLVFQGQIDGTFNAYAADTGRRLWSYATQAPVNAAPITYLVAGRQYVTVLTGISGSGTILGSETQQYDIDSRTTAKRVLTFALGGRGTLPAAHLVKLRAIDDPTFAPDLASAERGAKLFTSYCAACHGFGAISGGFAPDLRASPIPQSADAFSAVVRSGALLHNGMPRFGELPDSTLADLRQYLRSEGRALAAQ